MTVAQDAQNPDMNVDRIAPSARFTFKKNVLAAAITLMAAKGAWAGQAWPLPVHFDKSDTPGTMAYGSLDNAGADSDAHFRSSPGMPSGFDANALSLADATSTTAPVPYATPESSSTPASMVDTGAPSYRERPTPLGAVFAPSVGEHTARVAFPAQSIQNNEHSESISKTDSSSQPPAETSMAPAGVPVTLASAQPRSSAQGDLMLASFDEETLKQRGLDPKLAEYFREAARFNEGVTPVTLKVNGVTKGLVNARFNAQGGLCVDADLLERGGLIVPKALRIKPEKGDDTSGQTLCHDYRVDFSQTIITLSPGDNTVELIVPAQALSAPDTKVTGYTEGGTAALFNYDVLGVDSTNGGTTNRFLQATTEVGFNTADWLFRSRQLFTMQNGRSDWAHQYAYAQHTFVDQKAVFQAGEINLLGTNFPVGAIYGAQVFPEQALATQQGSGAVVQGIAQTQARVEVRQLGALVYSTLVPPGPFTLNNLPLLNGNANLDVTVIEANGGRRQFTVPAGSFLKGDLGAPQGFSAALGKLQNSRNANQQTPWLATVTHGWALGPQANLSAGVMASAPYQALSLGLDTMPLAHTRVTTNVTASHAQHGLQGTQAAISLYSELPAGIGINLSATGQSRNYRDLIDVVQNTASSRVRTEYSAGVSWGNKTLGSFSATYTRSTPFGSTPVQRLIGSWGRSFKHFSASVNVEHAIGSNGSQFAENQIYANLSIPLGPRNVSAYVNNSGSETHIGTRYSDYVNDMLSYNLMAETDSANHTIVTGADVNIKPRYTDIDLNASRYGSSVRQFSTHITGGAVVHGKGVTFSPYSVGDTFGIAKVGDLSGVKLDTPDGPAWTDHWGRAVIASMPEYSDTRIQLLTKSLPRNVDIKNGTQVLDAGHGSFNQIDFGVVKSRRVLMTAMLDSGGMLPKGATVTDDEDHFVTTVGDDGTLFVTNPSTTPNLTVSLPEGHACKLQYSLPEKAAVRFYEKATAVCVTSGAAH